MKAVLGSVLVGAFLLAGLFFVGLNLSRLPHVWRGEKLPSLPRQTWRGPEVNHRSFPVATFCLTLFVVGLTLLAGGGALRANGAVATGIMLVMAALFVLFPLWVLVNAVNRPRLLVPPPLRREPGWWAQWRSRRRRRKAGRAPTEHPVEVLDVRPLPEDAEDHFQPYLVAVCAQQDCDWQGDPVDARQPDAEATVRRQAAGHSANLTGPRRPLG